MAEVDSYERHVDLYNWAQSVPVVAVSTYLHLPDNSRFVSKHSSVAQPMSKAAVFLDRDGVIVEDVDFLRSPAQLRVLLGAAQALCMLQDRFYLIVVTNQSGIARGLLTEDDLLETHSELIQRLAAEGAVVDALYYCPHLSEGTVPDYCVECECRKPEPGMLLRAKHDWSIDLSHSFMIGDTPRDIEAGCAAGVKSILLSDGRTASPGAYAVVSELAQAARLILAESG